MEVHSNKPKKKELQYASKYYKRSCGKADALT